MGSAPPPQKWRECGNGPGCGTASRCRKGGKRQVRRMLITLGNPSQTLERVRIHTLLLGNLAPGKAAELTATELASLRGEAGNQQEG